MFITVPVDPTSSSRQTASSTGNWNAWLPLRTNCRCFTFFTLLVEYSSHRNDHREIFLQFSVRIEHEMLTNLSFLSTDTSVLILGCPSMDVTDWMTKQFVYLERVMVASPVHPPLLRIPLPSHSETWAIEWCGVRVVVWRVCVCACGVRVCLCVSLCVYKCVCVWLRVVRVLFVLRRK